MKTKLAFIILGALALTAFGATAQAKPHSAVQLRDLSRQAAANAQIRVPSTPILPQPGPRPVSGPVWQNNPRIG
jgi:hypothetical protein